jgi:enoyl-CoA hydratase/carnithine racemase
MLDETTDEICATFIEQGVGYIVLSDHEHRNALTARMTTELAQAVASHARDDAVRVILITHVGTVFSSGADLRPSAHNSGAAERPTLVRLLTEIIQARVPVVAYSRGHAFGGGLGMLVSADVSIVSTRALVGFTEVRVGVAPVVVGAVARRKMPLARLLPLMLTGQRITAPEAAEMGLITQTAEPDNLRQTVEDIIGELLKAAPGAVAEAKRSAWHEWPADISAALSEAEVWSRRLFEAPEGQSGMSAFIAREEPPWSPAEPFMLSNRLTIED